MDIAEKQVAGARPKCDAFDEAGAPRQFGEHLGPALGFAIIGENTENFVKITSALQDREIGVATGMHENPERGDAAEIAECRRLVAGEGGKRGKIVEVARGIGPPGERGGHGGGGCGIVFSIVGAVALGPEIPM